MPPFSGEIGKMENLWC